MKRLSLLAILVSIAALFGAVAPSHAVSDLVDFGDSGIVVVVEASGKEYGVAYIPWIPDEFYTFYPALPAAPGIPWPAGGGGGGAAKEPTPCERAVDHLTEVEEEIVWRQDTINWAIAHGYLWDAYTDGSLVYAGSERFQAVIDHLTNEIEHLREAREDAANDVKRHCGPPAQS